MSAPQKFPDLASALAAFRAGTCRRWVSVDGWQIDLAQARSVAEPVDVVAADQRVCLDRGVNFVASDPAAWDEAVRRNIADELRTAATVEAVCEELPPLAEPALGDASAYRCPWCSRPWDDREAAP